MKIAVLTVAFNEREWIKGCIDQFDGRFYHLVLVGEKPWHGDYQPDDTHAVALNHGASVERGYWKSEAEQRNCGMKLLDDFDWVIICDADERYDSANLIELEQILKWYYKNGITGTILPGTWDIYWKTADYVIEPRQPHEPPIAVSKGTRFIKLRATDSVYQYADVHMHHFSYVRTDEDMLKKIETFDESPNFDVQKWYNNVWLRWAPPMYNLHPVVPEQFRQAVWRPAPQGVKDLIPKI